MHGKSRSASMESACMSDDEDAFQALGSGVAISTPELQCGDLEDANSVFEPRRQPKQPPRAELQHIIGFANFLKRHASPPSKRVTAGGRIVPAGPKSPPPTFQVEHIDTVLKNAELQQRLQDTQAMWLRMRNEDENNTSIDSPRKEKHSVFRETSPASEPQQLSFDEQRIGNVRVPKSFKIVETIDSNSIIVRAGNSYLHAALNENGEVSYHSVALNTVSPWLIDAGNTGQVPQMAMYGQDGAHPPATSLNSQHVQHYAPAQNYETGAQATDPNPQDQFNEWSTNLFRSEPTTTSSFNSNSTVETSFSNHLLPDYGNSSTILHANAMCDDIKDVPLDANNFDANVAVELRRVTVGFEEQSKELKELERHLAMNDMHMNTEELGANLQRKQLLIESRDKFRRRKEHLETLQSTQLHRDMNQCFDNGGTFVQDWDGSVVLGQPTEPKFMQSTELPSNGLRPGKSLSPTAPAFVPFNTRGDWSSSTPSKVVSKSSSPNTVLLASPLKTTTSRDGSFQPDLSVANFDILDARDISSCDGAVGGLPLKPTGTVQPTADPIAIGRDDRKGLSRKGLEQEPSMRHHKYNFRRTVYDPNVSGDPSTHVRSLEAASIATNASLTLHDRLEAQYQDCKELLLGPRRNTVQSRSHRSLDRSSAQDVASLMSLPTYRMQGAAYAGTCSGPDRAKNEKGLSPRFHHRGILPVRGTKGSAISGTDCLFDLVGNHAEQGYNRAEVTNRLRAQLSNSEPTTLRGGYQTQGLRSEPGDAIQARHHDANYVRRVHAGGRLNHYDPKTQAVSLYRSAAISHSALEASGACPTTVPFQRNSPIRARGHHVNSNSDTRHDIASVLNPAAGKYRDAKAKEMMANILNPASTQRFQPIPVLEFNTAMKKLHYF